MIIRSEMEKSHFRTVESAATAIEPRCFVSTKSRRCSAQIPVRLIASSSVKDFWLDLIRTMVAPLGASDADHRLNAALYVSNSRSVPSGQDLPDCLPLLRQEFALGVPAQLWCTCRQEV